VASECFVLKASQFRVLGFRHPVLLMEIGRTLARRLHGRNRAAAQDLPATGARAARPAGWAPMVLTGRAGMACGAARSHPMPVA
jgi:hypothetical protein